MIDSPIELDFSLSCKPVKVVFGPVPWHRRQAIRHKPEQALSPCN